MPSLPLFIFFFSASVAGFAPPGLWTGRLQPLAAGTEEEEAPRQTGRPEQGHPERDGPEVL